jgi:hypothetical protein
MGSCQTFHQYLDLSASSLDSLLCGNSECSLLGNLSGRRSLPIVDIHKKLDFDKGPKSWMVHSRTVPSFADYLCTDTRGGMQNWNLPNIAERHGIRTEFGLKHCQRKVSEIRLSRYEPSGSLRLRYSVWDCLPHGTHSLHSDSDAAVLAPSLPFKSPRGSISGIVL